MPFVDLRAVETTVICPEPAGRRGRHMAAMLARLGMDCRFEAGPVEPGLSRAGDLARRVAAVAERTAPPFLLLEDDAADTPRFAPLIAVPEGTELLYLGVSTWGQVPEAGPTGILGATLSRTVSRDLARVCNMLSAHAVLVLGEAGRAAMIEAAEEAMAAGTPHDRGLARRQRGLRALAQRRPAFVQADALQRGVRRAFLATGTCTAGPLRPPAAADALELHLADRVLRLVLGRDAAGDPVWRQVPAFDGLPGRLLRLAVRVGPGGQGVRCQPF